MSKLTLYFTPGSPPARAVLLFIRYLGLDVELKIVDTASKEQYTPEYIKLNPAHQVPLLIDDDFILSESRAILQYLANSRKPGSDLYPIEPKARAIVDHRLNFDFELLIKNRQVTRPVLYGGAKHVTQQARDGMKEGLEILDKLLENLKWIAGDNLTIADFSAVAIITTIAECGYKLAQHKNVDRWYKQCQSLPGFDENLKGAKGLAARVFSGIEGSIY